MSKVPNILQGTDIPMITFSVYDEDGTVIDVADLNDYGVFVYNYQNEVKTLLETFKKTPAGGENAMVTVDAQTLGFIVSRTMTSTMAEGLIYAEIEVQVSASSDYESSLQNSGDEFVIANIKKSVSTF